VTELLQNLTLRFGLKPSYSSKMNSEVWVLLLLHLKMAMGADIVRFSIFVLPHLPAHAGKHWATLKHFAEMQ